MKDIKDYLHLYGIGFEVVFDNKTWKISAFRKELVELERNKDGGSLNPFGSIVRNQAYYSELIVPLRPLSDMTEDELVAIATMCYEKIFNDEPHFYKKELVPNGSYIGLKWEEREFRYGLSVNNDGVVFLVNGDFMSIPIFEIVVYLLSKGFDLFELIKEGLAIDKTTLKPKKQTS